MTLGQRLKQFRLNKGYTQSQLGHALGLSASAVGMYEQDRRIPDVRTALKYAEFFHVSLDKLLQPASSDSEYIDVEIAVNRSVEQLKQYANLVLEGRILTRREVGKLADAMNLGAEMVLHQLKKNNEK